MPYVLFIALYCSLLFQNVSQARFEDFVLYVARTEENALSYRAFSSVNLSEDRFTFTSLRSA